MASAPAGRGCGAARLVPFGRRGAPLTRFIFQASPVANGYAAALAESAQASGTLEAVHGDCEKMGAFDAGSPLVAVLSNPVLDDAKKRDVLAKMAAEASFTPVFVSFVNLLIDKRRANLLDQILARFEEIYCSMTDTQIANVTSAVKLETEQQARNLFRPPAFPRLTPLSRPRWLSPESCSP